jgi:hypothetical protein
MKIENRRLNMKEIKKKITAICLTMLMMAACTNVEIPPTAHAFIRQYFPESSIVLTERDTDEDSMEYSVWLNDGTKVEFDLQGQWQRVSRKKTGVPAKLIPSAIALYVKENYPDEAIFKLSRKTYGYKIELSNDLDLKFNPQGQFLEVVD